jgi:hypothetical protein
MNSLPTLAAGGAVGGLGLVVGVAWYSFTPKYWDVGYMPTQPGGGFNHQIHAGKLGMDCRYCHSKIEESAEANIPNVATCYGCHAEGKLTVYNTSPAHKEKTEFIRTAYASDAPIEWRRVHKVPDYVRNFPHNVHLNAGVSCYSCHGNIARMPVVYQHEPLSMGWCLECHRNPDPHLVPKKGDVVNGKTQEYDMMYKLFEVENAFSDPAKRAADGRKLYEQRGIASPENCGACHY